MDKTNFDSWVQGYLKAWRTNARADIEALFTEDATYLTQAFRQPWRGRTAIVEGWLSRADFQGNWGFEYHWIAIEGDTGVLEGVTTYHDENEAYANIWMIKLAADGRCYEYREHWVRRSDVQ
jgi:hypothetical protein